MSYSNAFYTNFTVQNTSFTRNGDVSANVSWVVTCIANQFQESFSTVYTIPSPGMTDQQVKDGAFNSIAGQILPWANRAVSQVPMSLGSTGTYDLGMLHIDGATNRVGVGTSNPGSTFQVQGDCDVQGAGTAYKIGGTNVVTSTALGSTIASSSLTSIGTLTTPLNLLTGQSYQINGASVLSATALGSGVTGSSLTSVGELSSLTTSGDVNFNKGSNSNFSYTPSTNIMTFGAGNTGGHFQVIGTFVQGVTGTTGQVGNAKFGYRNPGQFVELGADTANNAYIDFHSNVSNDVDYDTRILSVGGTAPNSGGGTMLLYAQNYQFQTIANRSDPSINNYLNNTYYPGALLPTTEIPRDTILQEYFFSGRVNAGVTTDYWNFPTKAKGGGGVIVNYQVHITISNGNGNWNSYIGSIFRNGNNNTITSVPATTAGSSPVIQLSNSLTVPRIRFTNDTDVTATWAIRMLAVTTNT